MFASDDQCAKDMNAFIEVISNSSFCEDMHVTGEEMDNIISSLKTGKSAGHDDIQAEHLLYAGGAVIDPLYKLMTAILVHGYMPNGMMEGVVIPVIKSKSKSANDCQNYPLSVCRL